MRIQFIRFTMSCPPGVTHSCWSVKTGFINKILKVLNPACAFKYLCFAVYKSHSGRIITAIFKSFQTIYNYFPGRLRTNITDNSAHTQKVLDCQDESRYFGSQNLEPVSYT